MITENYSIENNSSFYSAVNWRKQKKMEAGKTDAFNKNCCEYTAS